MSNTVEIIFKGTNQVGDAADSVKESLGGVQEAAQKTSNAFDTAMGVLAAEQVQQFAGALSGFMTSAIEEAGAAETGMAQLDAVLKSTGGAAGVTADMATDLANSLSTVTRFEDDAILSGENMLLTFTNIGKDVFPEATQTILDMSQALGQDLQSSAVQLGKALNDPVAGITALSRVGVTFTDAQRAMIKTMVQSGDIMGAQKLILQELQKEFGGSAEAAGKTFPGALDRLNNTWGNFKETIGTAITENENFQALIDKLITLVDGLADAFVKLPDGVQTSIVAFVGLIAVLGKLMPMLVSAKVLLGGLSAAKAAGAATAAASATGAGTAAGAGAAGAAGAAGIGAAATVGIVVVGTAVQAALINIVSKAGAKAGKAFGDALGIALPPELAKLQQLNIEKGPFSAETWRQEGVVIKWTLANILMSASTASTQLVTLMGTGFDQMTVGANSWATQTMNTTTAWATNTLMVATTASTQLVTLFQLGWTQITTGATAWAVQMVATVSNAGSQLISNITGWGSRVTQAALSVGKGIVGGIWNGIQSGWEWLESNISASMDSLLQWVKDKLGISSPSRVFAESVGLPMAQGIEKGFTSGMGITGATMAAALQPAAIAPSGRGSGGGSLTVNGRFYSPVTQDERRIIHRDMRRTGEDLLSEVFR